MRTIWLVALLVAPVAYGAIGTDLPAPPQFDEVVVDQGMAGDCKMVGDIDGDGLDDAVVGGGLTEGLVWYRWPDWRRTVIAVPNVEFTTDAALGDVDADGDLDIVVPDGPDGANLLWFENPLPAGDPGYYSWTRHVVGSLGYWGKDVELADFDHDGSLDIGTRTETMLYVFFGNGGSSWTQRTIRSDLNGEGMISGDVDRDGDADLIGAGFWLENPEPAGNARADAWPSTTIVPDLYNTIKALVTDIDADGVSDVLFSCSEGTGDVLRCEPTTGNPHGAWTVSVIVPDLNRCHTLQAADVDVDGDMDIVLGQMHTSTTRELAVYVNNDGVGGSWTKDIIDTTGVHNAVVADFGADGVPDIFGCNWTGNPPVRFWHNDTSPVCPADLTTTNASAEDPAYGQPDGQVTAADIQYYANLWVVEDPQADLTTQNAAQGDPAYGQPDGAVTAIDLQYYVNAWVAGCP